MKRKILWLILSSMMVAALLLSSCAPAPPAPPTPPAPPEEEVVTPPLPEEEEVAPAPPKKEEKVVTEEEVAPSPEEPQYGGVINYVLISASYDFDQGYSIPPRCRPIYLTHDELFTGDWAKGLAGTGEYTWWLRIFLGPPAEVPSLCESWETPDEETVIYHIRKGVHWQDKPPLNGRELTADDVAFTIKRQMMSDLPLSYKVLEGPDRTIKSVEATDRYTVVVKCAPEFIWWRVSVITSEMSILAPELGGEYPGDFRSWENCIGTGPFMLEEEVAGSSLSFVRNPNYWRKDPLHPQNTLPYADGVNLLIIPDASTRMAALRTGKIDVLRGLLWEDKGGLVKTNPELQWGEGLATGGAKIGMRLDNPELPWHDIRVRRALSMGVDRQAIAKEYYGGYAKVFTFPIPPLPEYKDMYTPLDECSESVQEQYEYNPEKARQLLAEAGYPDGFQAEIVCEQTQADLLSIIKAMWADIGVDLFLDVRESGTYRTVSRGRKHKQMLFRSGGRDPERMGEFRSGHDSNASMVDDPYINEMYETKLVKGQWDRATFSRVMKEELVPHILEQCWYIDPPDPMNYAFWQPWLKGYHGEFEVGYVNTMNWLIYVWLDQELKKEMGH